MNDINLEFSENALLWNDMNDAIVGMSDKGTPIYSIPKLISTCMVKYNMTEEEAVEWVDFNMLNAYIGDDTPIHMYPMDDEY